ncbi:hypothetical protein GGI23_001728 [Coemansia sp. RSA 2559]|nr:hypothetical protein GGI23_001728 [Coemansia sp. RSA 2559]
MADAQNSFQATPPCPRYQSTKGSIGVDRKQSQQQTNADIDPAHCFPVRIRYVPGRGRGYFAARGIAKGETVLKAVPLACAISEDWVKNTCWWCFAYDPRKTHSVGAVDHETLEGLVKQQGSDSNNSKKQPRQSVQYKGVFCSIECRQKAVLAHGGQSRWHSYVALLGAIDSEVRAFRGRQNCTRPTRLSDYSTRQHLNSTVRYLTAPDPSLSTFDDAPAVIGDNARTSMSWNIDFDPDDSSDQQLSDWISQVWDTITAHKLFQQHLPDSSQRELVRLISNAMCLEDAAANPTELESWQALVLSLKGAERDFAPPCTLPHVRNNEVDFLRATLRRLHAETPGSDTPSTISPVRLPFQPTPHQIEQSQWGAVVFRAAASAYMLLVPAWRVTTKSHVLGKLTHERFRTVYYREMANSFGIWESAEDDVRLPPSALIMPAEEQPVHSKGAESEWLGFVIYSTAVYFNHSCAPNVRKVREQRTMNFISCRDIAQDEELFITYGSVAESGPERRSRLQEHFFFECTCDRCLAEASECLNLVPTTIVEHIKQ